MVARVSTTANLEADDFQLQAQVFRAIADPTRRSILDLLARGEKAVTDLLGHFAFSQPALSRHLKVLLRAGLVRRRSQGRARIYALEAKRLELVHDWVSHYAKFWSAKLDDLGDLLEELP